MLTAHMNANERVLIETSRIPANAGHSLHKGTPREAFIKQFLESHLPSHVAIGTGEIIDADSKPNEQRNQHDIILYKKNYPKLDFGGGINGFLIESVIATIEVKSTLDNDGVMQAVKAANNSKKLISNGVSSFYSGYIPPKVLNYVIAYDGPAKMDTVLNWLISSQSNIGIIDGDLPLEQESRLTTPASSLDGVFILGKGFIYFDNVLMGFANNSFRKSHVHAKWIYKDIEFGSLLLLFLFLQNATANIDGSQLNPIPYLKSMKIDSFSFG